MQPTHSIQELPTLQPIQQHPSFQSYVETRQIVDRQQTVPQDYFTKQRVWVTVLKSSVLSLVVLLLLKAVFLGLVVNEIFDGDVDGFLLHMRTQPVKLALLFLVFYIAGAIFLFPVSVLLTSMAFTFSHIWGPMDGLLITFSWNAICINLSYTLVFLSSRYLFGDQIYSRMIRYERFFTFDRAVRRRGATILFLLRCSILLPNSLINYACAVTDLSLWQFFVGNTALLPVSLIWIYFGTSAATVQQQFTQGLMTGEEVVTTGISFLFMITGIFFIMRFIQRLVDNEALELQAS